MTHEDAKLYEAIGARIRQLRDRRKMTQAAVGAAIGVTWQSVAKYEKGLTAISVGALVRVAKALGTSAARLLP